MSDLFNSPVLLIEQPSRQLNYQITDPQGAALAYVTQVAGNRPKTGLAGLFADPDTSRVAVQVARPDGTPLFFVDRAAGRYMMSGFMQAPCAVVAPDGRLIGHLDPNTAELAQGRLTGDNRLAGGYVPKHRLLDAEQRPLCRIAWEPSRAWEGATETHWEGGRYAVFIDMNGTQIAHLDISASDRTTDRFTLQIGYQLPDPLRTLVIAAPLAMDLMRGS